VGKKIRTPSVLRAIPTSRIPLAKRRVSGNPVSEARRHLSSCTRLFRTSRAHGIILMSVSDGKERRLNSPRKAEPDWEANP
jgi:hypothetical protein